MKTSTVLWAGNDDSFRTFMLALESSYQKGCLDKEIPEEEHSRLLTVQDGIGIITIHGALTNLDTYYNKFFGLISYPEIVQAFHEAAADPEVKEILMDVSSPGGAVDGVLDAVSAIQNAAAVKPITAFTSSLAASAGYWIISPAQKRYATATSIVGSIGVVAKHVEYSKMMKEAGITETVFRAGEFKQIVNSSEPLSAKAEEMIQSQIEYTYSIFVDSVAENLVVSSEMVRRKMAEGREFIGQQAVDAGLINAVSDFESVYMDLLIKAQKKGDLVMKNKKYNMSAALAAASAGIQMSAGDVPEPEVPETPVVPEIPAAPESPEAKAEGNTPETKAEGETPKAGETPETKPEDTGIVAHLKAELKEMKEEVFGLKLAAKENESLTTQLASLKGIVAASVNNMTVALGGSKEEGLEAKDTATLVALHDSTLKRTMESFKTGGISAMSTEADDEKPVVGRFEARLKAVTGTKTK